MPQSSWFGRGVEIERLANIWKRPDNLAITKHHRTIQSKGVW